MLFHNLLVLLAIAIRNHIFTVRCIVSCILRHLFGQQIPLCIQILRLLLAIENWYFTCLLLRYEEWLDWMALLIIGHRYLTRNDNHFASEYASSLLVPSDISNHNPMLAIETRREPRLIVFVQPVVPSGMDNSKRAWHWDGFKASKANVTGSMGKNDWFRTYFALVLSNYEHLDVARRCLYSVSWGSGADLHDWAAWLGVIDQSKDEKSIHLFQHWERSLRFSMECDGLLFKGK
jgi:hypothetical protein